MKHQTIILTIILLTLSTFHVKADSWTDPDWKEMIDSSDVIALIEYASEGDFRAKARPLTIYKGKLNTKEIWISGFSNRYGPIDKMSPGDKYIVFLNFYEPTERALEYWKEQIKEQPELNDYYEALKTGNAYYVWTPTSGDLRVKGKTVQYDLLQTSYYSKQNYYPLAEFETFLKATSQTKNSKFHEELLKKVKTNATKEISAQYLMTLYLSSFKTYDPVFQTIANEQKPEPCYALAQLLGEVKDEKSRDILVQLLDIKNSIVQGEVVRQLSDEDPEFIGPILLAHLDSAGEGGIYPSNIMDPGMNRVDGGKIEIIKTLGKLQYKPAAKELLPLLNTDNEYLFKLTIEVLQELGSRDYIPYINEHLEKGSRDLILDICYIITDNNLEECIPSLMKFVSTHDKSIHPSMEYSISKYSGLAHFPTDTVKEFLYSDFLSVLEMESGGTIDNKMDWVKEYIDVFTELDILRAKEQLYDFMYNYYGFNYDFKLNSKMFEQKKIKEDSISRAIKEVVIGDSIKSVEVLALIKKNQNQFDIENYSARVKVSNSDQFDMLFSKLELNGFSKDHILMTSGSYTYTHGALEIRRFGDGLMTKFLNYITISPDTKDIEFLKNLKAYKYYSSDYDLRKLDEAIEKAENNLNK
ncbi:hypothetical protein [Flammeovirga sp. SubArs3]|uniref:HEAT repeat domain-containing protein n=1 Tax=Flammeovirga sp. SubArs3 TaxID=2995316 RepID=UPI00248D1635|nr:hypothetical protein [Flammeovirga sp. SubArs3]